MVCMWTWTNCTELVTNSILTAYSYAVLGLATLRAPIPSRCPSMYLSGLSAAKPSDGPGGLLHDTARIWLRPAKGVADCGSLKSKASLKIWQVDHDIHANVDAIRPEMDWLDVAIDLGSGLEIQGMFLILANGSRWWLRDPAKHIDKLVPTTLREF